MQGANSKNRRIRIIMIKIVSLHGKLVNISQSEVTEASGESIAWIILSMHLVNWVTLVLISGIYVTELKSFPWDGEILHGKPSTGEEGSAPQTQQLDRLWNAVLRMSPGQEGIVLRVKRQTQDFWSQQKQAHIDYQAHLVSALNT